MGWQRYNYVLAGLLGAVAFVTIFLLLEVFASVFFAITVAYVLYPLRTKLVEQGLGNRLAAALSTVLALAIGFVLFAPLAVSAYLRRGEIVTFLDEFPETATLSAGGFTHSVDVAALLETAEATLEDIALQMAGEVVALLLKFFVFILVVYVLLLRPGTVRAAILEPIPDQYHDIVFSYHEQVESILNAIYVLQAAVAFGTFLVGLPFFYFFGYESAFTLAVLAGILQFLPVVGPSILMAGLAGLAVASGEVVRAILVFVLGSVFIGGMPDLVIRPRLARLTASIPGSLYFVGFVGGILSVGMIGVIAGPVAVALVAKSVGLLSEEPTTRQSRLETTADAPPAPSQPDEPPPSTG